MSEEKTEYKTIDVEKADVLKAEAVDFGKLELDCSALQVSSLKIEPLKFEHIIIDWDKVKTIDDIKLILQEIYPNAMIPVPPHKAERFKHLVRDEQRDE